MNLSFSIKFIFSDNIKMISDNNMGSHNKLIIKRNYNKKNENVIIDDKNIKEIEKEFYKKLSNKLYTFEEKMKKKLYC